MNLSDYRIFTDEDGYVSVAAKKVGDTVTVLAETKTFSDAFDAILEDAGLKVQVLERDMNLGGKSYKPKPEDWE